MNFREFFRSRSFIYPGLALVIIAGIAVRIPFTFHSGFDDQFFTAWAAGLLRYGLTDSYKVVPGLNYPPLYLYLLDGIGHVFRWYSSEPTSSQGFVTLQKSLNVLIDTANALLLFAIVRRVSNERRALGLAALWLLNPYTIYDSAVWGQIDTFISFFLLLAFYFLQEENLIFVYGALALGVLTKAQLAVVVPLFLFYMVRRFGWKAQWLPVLVAFVLAVLLLEPFAAAGTLSIGLTEAYVKASSYFPYLSLNAHNIWWLVSDPYNITARSDAVPFIGSLTAKAVGVILFGIAYLIALFGLAKKPTQSLRLADLAFASAFVYLAFYCLNTEMHERYLYPFFALWLLTDIEPLFYYGIYFILSITQTLSLAIITPFIPQAFWLRENWFPAITYPLSYLNIYCFVLTGCTYLPFSSKRQKPEYSNLH